MFSDLPVPPPGFKGNLPERERQLLIALVLAHTQSMNLAGQQETARVLFRTFAESWRLYAN